MIIWVAAALLVGFVLGAIEGRAAVQRAQEIAKAADTEAEAIKEQVAHALNVLHEHINNGDHEIASEYAHIVATLRSVV